MVEQAEILEYDADAPPEAGDGDLVEGRASRPKIRIMPRVGLSESSMRRSKVVLPAPDGPVRNWKLCGSMEKLRSRTISTPIP